MVGLHYTLFIDACLRRISHMFLMISRLQRLGMSMLVLFSCVSVRNDLFDKESNS